MFAGWIGVMVLSALKLTTKNDMIQLLYGGDSFHPFLTGGDVLLVLIQLALVAFLAVLYPMFVARSITPLDAISRE
jgi:ABC-type antimicrobial peptide transport system permease subunit